MQAQLRSELVHIVRSEAERAKIAYDDLALIALRQRCQSRLLRARADGAIPTELDVTSTTDLIAGAVWSRLVHGEEMSERHVAAVVDAVLLRSA